jgi:hypothetical protein
VNKTDYAGLTRLGPDDSLSEDNSSFQTTNPVVTDRYLRRAIEHRHTGAAGLAAPDTAPTLSVDTSQGIIPADVALSVTYTLVDAFGGETLPAPVSTITTSVPLDTPDDEPTLELIDTGGSLRIGTYNYAVAVTDTAGGETPIGPYASLDRDAGPANASITVTGLATIAGGVDGATGWRLYRSINAQPFYFLAEGDLSMNAVTDDGSLCVDCTGRPLDDDQNTTHGTNSLRIALPTGGPVAAATAIRVYVTDGSTFITPCLLDELSPSEAGTVRTYTQLDVLDGQPPDANQSLPQPGKITDAEIDLRWRAPVANQAALPPTGNTAGDIRQTLATRALWTWTGTAWETLVGGEGGGGGGGLEGRTEVVLNEASEGINPAGQLNGQFDLAPGYRVLKIQASHVDSRVRLYGTAAKRSVDYLRPDTTTPSGDHGVMLDYTALDPGPTWITPPIDGYNQDAPATNAVYWTLDNDGATNVPIQVTLTLVATEKETA